MAGGMIPPAVIEALSATPISLQMREAAAELLFRASHGEFDDLDDMPRTDLEMLAAMLAFWAGRVAELEMATRPSGDGGVDATATR